jgi:hypothetical protein
MQEDCGLMYTHNTYDRRIQLGASRQRKQDAEALHNAGRWTGAMYLAGYAIECALCAAICLQEDKFNIKDTKAYKKIQSTQMHNLASLLEQLPILEKTILLKRNSEYKVAWDTITNLWQKDALRYWDKLGSKDDSKRLIDAVKLIHEFILSHQ